MEITAQSIIADILRDHPECLEVFDRYGMPCLTCMGAATGTISEGAMMHDVDANKLLADLQSCCAKHSPESA